MDDDWGYPYDYGNPRIATQQGVPVAEASLDLQRLLLYKVLNALPHRGTGQAAATNAQQVLL